MLADYTTATMTRTTGVEPATACSTGECSSVDPVVVPLPGEADRVAGRALAASAIALFAGGFVAVPTELPAKNKPPRTTTTSTSSTTTPSATGFSLSFD